MNALQKATEEFLVKIFENKLIVDIIWYVV
jgi:hypothetical protein